MSNLWIEPGALIQHTSAQPQRAKDSSPKSSEPLAANALQSNRNVDHPMPSIYGQRLVNAVLGGLLKDRVVIRVLIFSLFKPQP